MNDTYSFDYGLIGQINETSATKNETNETKVELNEDEKEVISLIKKNPEITQKKLHEESGISLGTIKRILPRLQEKGVIERIGNKRSGKWDIKQ